MEKDEFEIMYSNISEHTSLIQIDGKEFSIQPGKHPEIDGVILHVSVFRSNTMIALPECS